YYCILHGDFPPIYNERGQVIVTSATPTPTPAPPPGTATVADFNGDGHPDFVLFNPGTHQTAVWYMNNNVVIGEAFGPTLPDGWLLRAAADFNGDGHTDCALFNPDTGQTVIVYLSGLSV